MNIIIFSKDRACQLEFFLRSMSVYFKEWDQFKINIICKISNDNFGRGYLNLMRFYKQNPNINFIRETNFKADVLSCISNENNHTVFFTDDDIWMNHFSITDSKFEYFKEHEKNILCFSLRLNTNLKYCYCTNIEIKTLPSFDNHNVYYHRGTQGYYNYQMSLDGHIFKTSDILPLLKTLQYDSPNWLEYQLSMNPIEKSMMMCCDNSIIVNNPCSVVQTVCKNRNENIDNSFINNQYLSGKKLSLKMIKNLVVESCHQPIKLIFE